MKQRFESSLACMRHRDHRTYAEVLSQKGGTGHKVAFTNAGHNSTPVINLTAPRQVVNTVFSTSMNNSIDSKHRPFHTKSRHINSRNMDVSVRNPLLSDPIDNGPEVNKFQVSGSYNIPVKISSSG